MIINNLKDLEFYAKSNRYTMWDILNYFKQLKEVSGAQWKPDAVEGGYTDGRSLKNRNEIEAMILRCQAKLEEFLPLYLKGNARRRKAAIEMGLIDG